MNQLKIVKRDYVKLLSPEVEEMLREYRWRRTFNQYECLMKEDDHGPKGANPRVIPYINSKRGIVYYGTDFNGSYNHHNQIAKFNGKYYFAWSNGFRNEEDAGQRILMAESDNGIHWSEPWVVLSPGKGESIAHNCVGLHIQNNEMYLLIMTEDTIHDETVTGMRRIKPDSHEVRIFKSSDAHQWEQVYSFGGRVKWLFEAPRLTAEGRLLCVCNTVHEGPAVLLWPGSDITEDPEFIFVPEPEGASFPYGESTWYQLDSGRIMIFWRDEGASCQLYVNWSDDGGRTFSVPALSDLPDSMSRVYAGRLQDGRYYICNNAIANLLDRSPLMLLVSDDGVIFNKVYMINDGPTVQRFKGMLKINGYQYPCCLVDGEKLIVAYDQNKEDPMVEIIDTSKI